MLSRNLGVGRSYFGQFKAENVLSTFLGYNQHGISVNRCSK